MTYVLMKVLESSPSRYDKGIDLITFGSINKIHDQMVESISEGSNVLDIGCGTGKLSLKAALKGANVLGIDINPQMLEIAKNKAKELNLENKVDFKEMGIAEIDKEPDAKYDFVVSSLCFSELDQDEIQFGLGEIKRILKPKGRLIIADEVVPGNIIKRVLVTLIRIPLIILTYIATQTTTNSVRNLPLLVKNKGYDLQKVKYYNFESFIQLEALKAE